MNLGLQVAAFIFIWPHLSPTAQVVCLVLAILDLVGAIDWARARIKRPA